MPKPKPKPRPKPKPKPEPQPALVADQGPQGAANCVVVGLGASAGGLHALDAFFSNLPDDTGLAFAVVTHLHVGQPSLLPTLLSRKTNMPVVELTTPTPVEPNHVYLAPPGWNLGIQDRVFRPAAPEGEGRLRFPIDFLFRSLAADIGERAVGVVLSGTGSDGALGVTAIKAALGMVMAQQEESAEYAGMPRSAIATETVDFVLPASEMAKQLIAYTRSPRFAKPTALDDLPAPLLREVIALLRAHTRHDFAHYKESTVRRRLQRRMSVHHVDTLAAYLDRLRNSPAELDLLFKDLLIGVTSFFRDPEAFEALAQGLRVLLAAKPPNETIRAWIPGCSTGEEAYSIAMLLRELQREMGKVLEVQIFATDLDPTAIDVARAGCYPLGIASDVSEKRLQRFFVRADDSFRIKKDLREMVVFAQQNVIEDPPFTRLDLLSCRNLLIYLDATLQKRLLPVFHYALCPDGLLFLGTSESLGTFAPLFDPIDKRWKLFRRKAATGQPLAALPAALLATGGDRREPTGDLAPHLTASIEHLLVRELVPPTALVRERGDVLHIHGRTGLFLEPAPGPQAAVNILKMARDGLSLILSAMIRDAAEREGDVVRRDVRVRSNGGHTLVDLRVRRILAPEQFRGLFLVSFEHAHAQQAEDGREPQAPDRIIDLERALLHTKESHQGTVEELETANEELKSTNEELQSTNEELQSANEELETSKEEMQSLNEELNAVNVELETKLDELSRVSDDMKNLLNGTDIATVFLDNDLHIKRFTDRARRVIRLIPTDVGRPIGDLVSALQYDRISEDAAEVLRTLIPREAEVRGEGGTVRYLMRILPYRTADNVIDGLVLTFVDVTQFRALQESEQRLLSALRDSPVAVWGQDLDLRYTWTCSAVLGRAQDEALGMTDDDLFAADEAAMLTELKRGVLETGAAARKALPLSIDGDRRWYDFYVEPTRQGDGPPVGLSCVAFDVTQWVGDRTPGNKGRR